LAKFFIFFVPFRYASLHKKDEKLNNNVVQLITYGLKLVTDKDGKPDFKFIQMRYAGTRATDDQGVFNLKSLLAFRVANHKPSRQKIDSIKQVIKLEGTSIKSLKPIAISNLKAELIHAADTNNIDSLSTKYNDGFFESTDKKSTSTNWTERDFILRLNNTDAQIFWEGFQTNQPTISVNYTYSSKMFTSKSESYLASGSTDLSKELEEKYKENDSIPDQNILEMVVNSGSIAIEIDTEKWPDLIKQIDINERTPAGYPVLDVYCYDFNSELNHDLYAKRIEIKAVGVNNSAVEFKYTFKNSEPDVYAKNIKFKYAIKLDQPYQYRVTKIYLDGLYQRSEWTTKASWSEILDITTKN
jgi:hypothetical protein